MKRIVEFGHFENTPAILVKDDEGEMSRAFIVDKASAFAVEQFIAYVARLDFIGTKVEFHLPDSKEAK